MKFELYGRLVFEADDIRDAFRRLSLHFKALADGNDSDLPLVGTDVKMKQSGTKTPIPPAEARHTTLRGKRKS